MSETNTHSLGFNGLEQGHKGTKKLSLKELSDGIDKGMIEEQTIHEENRKKYLIDVKEEIPPPQIAWGLSNTQKEGEEILGTLGNFSLIIGKAKAKKSFFVNIAVTCALSMDLLFGRFKSNLPPNQKVVLYFDTEQGKYHVQKATKRICKQIDVAEPENLYVYYLRSLTPAERIQFIEIEIYNTPSVGFVVIDGIKDLVSSINDEREATMIASKLLKWTEERNIHIVTVLHQNKGDNNARGHIGTELVNKAETVLSVTVVENDKEVSIVEPLECRNREPESIAFSITDDGLPFLVDDYQPPAKRTSNSSSGINLEDYQKFQLLTEVFSHGPECKYGALVSQLKIAYKKQIGKEIGDNKIKDLITYCKNNGWVVQSVEKGPYTLGKFNNTSV
jgi:hypothetical protein